MAYSRNSLRRHRRMTFPLFDWADARRALAETRAGRWLVRRFGLPPTIAETIAREAGLGGDA